MKKNIRPASWGWFLLFSLIFFAQVIPNLFGNSPTDDEPMEITNGYFYWLGDVVTDDFHPPIPAAIAAIPLHFLSLKNLVPASLAERQLRAYFFFFQLNLDRSEEMLHWGRLANLLFGLGIGWLLFLLTRKAAPEVPGTALTLWVFEPTLLAYSGLALADLTVTFFFLGAVLAFRYYLQAPGVKTALWVGILAAAAVGCKFSALVLLPIFILLQLIHGLGGPQDRTPDWRRVAGHWLAGLCSFFLSLGLVYLPGTWMEPRHLLPWSYFWHGLMDMARYSDFHHPTYFWGHSSRQNHWLYFPAAFALKTTLPFLLLVLGAIAGSLLGKIRVEPWVWISPLLVFLSVLPVQNLGVRYLLPAYPFLILWVARGVGSTWTWQTQEGRGPQRLVLGGLLLWHVASVLASAPHMISYFNDLVPREKKIFFLGDSNLDMGQDLKRLAETARERHWGPVRLAQFGGAVDPSVYGMKWEYWTRKDLEGPQPGRVYAVNALLLQLGPEFSPNWRPIAQSWVMTTPPTGRVGDTWFYFEAPGKPLSDRTPQIQSVSVF
jgi:hypothetical protein